MAMREALMEAMHTGRDWRDLAIAANYLTIELEKGRITEKKALEKLLTAIPDCPHGKLIKLSLADSKDLRRELDDVTAAANAMADAMAAIAPFDRAFW